MSVPSDKREQEGPQFEPVYRRTSDAGSALVPLFPVGSFTPQSKCPHKGPIPAGSPFICMVCHQSGLDRPAESRREPAASRPGKPDRGNGVVYTVKAK